ncbi:MAG: nuclear transport factor 2 family protein [Pseudomonadota bacterium]
MLKSLIAALAGAALLVSAPANASEQDPRVETVLEMVEAWNTMDWPKVVDLFAEDGSLHSMMVEPIVGRESIRTRIYHIGEGIEEITLNVRNIGVVGDVVFIERIDEFTYNGHSGSVPVVGVIEVEGDRIKEWREYYDRAELLEAMGLGSDFDKDAR